MEVRNSQFAAFIDVFTPNTYVMVIISDHTLRMLYAHLISFFMNSIFNLTFLLLWFIASAAMLLNIRNARKHFENIEKVNSTGRMLR